MAEEGAMTPLRACELIQPVCAGIAAAHQQKIVHRDLKPLNVMIQDDVPISEGLKILDFGLAKIKSGELLGSFVAAETTGLMGSPFYMAPEQWSDEPPDARADIYSLGVIFYQMLCGEVPFKGSSIPSIMKKHLTLEVPSLASKGVEVPPQIEAVIRHALEKDPKYRTPSAEEFANELREAMTSARATLQRTGVFGEIDPGKTMASTPTTGPGTVPRKGPTTASDPLAATISASSRLGSFNLLRAFRRSRIARASAGLLVLAAAAFAQYRLVSIPRLVDLKTIERFSPAKISVGQEELIIEGLVLDSEKRMLVSPQGENNEPVMLFSHDGEPNETVDVIVNPAQLNDETIEYLKSGPKLPSTPTRIAYEATDTDRLSGGEPCSTNVEILAAPKMSDEIHIFQLQLPNPAVTPYPRLEMRTKGTKLFAKFDTMSPDESKPGPGCQYMMSMGERERADWQEPITGIQVTTVIDKNADKNAELSFTFKPLKPNSTLVAAKGGLLSLDLPPSIHARSVSIKSPESENPSVLLSVRSTNNGPLLTIEKLEIGSNQIQLTIGAKGLVEIDGEPWTVKFSSRIREHKLLAALLAVANIALLALAARLIFKTPKLALTQTT